MSLERGGGRSELPFHRVLSSPQFLLRTRGNKPQERGVAEGRAASGCCSSSGDELSMRKRRNSSSRGSGSENSRFMEGVLSSSDSVEDLEHGNGRADGTVDVGPHNAQIGHIEASITQPTVSQARRLCKQGWLNRARWLLLEAWLGEGSLDTDA
jgi:hypothetical protein